MNSVESDLLVQSSRASMQAVIIVSFVLMAFFAITTAFKAWQQNDAVVSCEDYSDTELVTVTGGD
jgi:hypothetical protein